MAILYDPPHWMYVSSSGITEHFPREDTISPLSTCQYHAETASEAEAAAASNSSDIQKKFRSHSDKIAEGEE